MDIVSCEFIGSVSLVFGWVGVFGAYQGSFQVVAGLFSAYSLCGLGCLVLLTTYSRCCLQPIGVWLFVVCLQDPSDVWLLGAAYSLFVLCACNFLVFLVPGAYTSFQDIFFCLVGISNILLERAKCFLVVQTNLLCSNHLHVRCHGIKEAEYQVKPKNQSRRNR